MLVLDRKNVKLKPVTSEVGINIILNKPMYQRGTGVVCFVVSFSDSISFI